MKKIILFSLIFLSIICSRQQLHAIGLTDFGLNAGLATPSEQVNDVYNSSKFQYGENETGEFIKETAELGYHIGMNIRFGLSESAYLVGGIALNRFPETSIDVINPDTKETLAVISTTTNIVPISAGINYYLLRSLIGIYGIGELQYNYISNSVDVKTQDMDFNFPLSNSPTDSRIGAAIGAGVDFDLQVLTLGLEAKYNLSNIIKADDDEETKSYLTVTLGVYF